MFNLQIRKYEHQDWERIQAIHDSARKLELNLARLDDAFIPLVQAAEAEGLFEYNVYVACLNSIPVGFIAYSQEEIAWLYVDPMYTKKGIGKSLVMYVLEKQLKNKHISIEVLKGNEPALALYRSCGFIDKEIVSGIMPGNEHFHVTVHVLTTATTI